MSALPEIKCQDITITGTLLTCAVRMGFQAMVIERNFGLNLAYTSAFDEVPTDLPDAQRPTFNAQRCVPLES